MRLRIPAFLAALSLGFSPLLSAQSLGEAAQKERERREKLDKGKPEKVYKDNDLRGRARGGTVSNAGATGANTAPTAEASPKPAGEGATAEGDQPEKTEEELRAEEEQQWRERLQKARENVTQLNERIQRIEQDLGDLTVNLYGATRTNMLKELEQRRGELVTAQQAVADLEDEGRRKRFR